MRIFVIVLILGLCALGYSRPSKKEDKNAEVVDESDKELIRVARGDVEEDEEPQEKSHKEKKRSTEAINKRAKRAAEEDAFFQALLARSADRKKEKKRSFDEGADNTGYIIRDDWKGDSKISDADRQELESLFSAINSPDDGGKEKLEETRSLKPGLEGKVQQFIEWLMSQPPDKFTQSLSHILDVEQSLTKMFYDGQNQQQQRQQQQAQPQQQPQQQDAGQGNSNKDPSQPQGNCKRKCFTLQLGNTECKIICEPPVIEQPAPAPAYGAYPQQAIYGQAQPYPYLGQMSAPCTPPACQPGQMYAGYTQAQQYPVQAAYPAIGTRPAPVQEGCVGRSCDQPKDENKESQSDKPEKQEKQDKPAPAAPKPAQASSPYTFKTPGATIFMDPVRITTEPEPQIPVAPMVPGQVPMAVPQPYVMPQAPQAPQVPYGITISGLAAPQVQPQAPVPAPYFKPMPTDCQDYSQPRCQVFLDWPTNENSEIKASLRFKQNWHDDYRRPSATKYRIFKTEVEKAIKDVYSLDPNFKDVRVTGFSEEDMKVAANFVLYFTKPEDKALRYLSNAISNNYLQSMPVFKNTLLRDGLTHHHRSFVVTQKELDAVPKVKVESSHKLQDDILTTESRSYLGCFKDRKPGRDLPRQFTKYEMTPEWCVGKCNLAGYRYAGLQYGYLCFCGNKFGKYGEVDDGECSSLCFGDKTRNCGSFWHNSVFSTDGEKHNNIELDKEDDKEQSGSGESDEEDEEQDIPEHTEVANHLMKAAEAALKAAKKLLPHPRHEKSKRTPDEELQIQSEDAISALTAAEKLMGSSKASIDHKRKEKRDAEGDGRDLLVAYLSDVGGYDRNYRDVGDEDESGSSESKDKEKFEYRRMVIDESGDGEFVEKSKDEQLKARKRREVSEPWDESFDGPKKMALRAAPVEQVTKRNDIPAREGDTEDDTNRLEDTSGDAEQPEVKTEAAEPVTLDNRLDTPESGDSEEADEASESEDIANSGQSGFENKSDETDETEESGLSGSDETEESGDEADQEGSQEADSARIVREVHDDESLLRHRRELPKEFEEGDKPKARSKRQSALLDDNKLTKMKDHVDQGAENIMSLIMDIYQSRKTLANLQQVVQQLKQDVMQQMDVPAGQKEQVKSRLRDTVKQTVVKKVNELAQSIRQEVEDYKQGHQAVSQQAKEALTAILDIPVFQDKVSSIKSQIRKRAVEIEKEYKKAKRGSEELPSILKEHFKRNAPDLKGETRLSRSHRDLNL